MILPTATLARVRADIEVHTFPTTCYIVRNTRTNTEGGWSEAWAIVGTVACRKAPIGERDRIAGGQVAAEASYVLTMPALTDVRAADEVTVDTETFAVVAARKRSPQDELARRVFVTGAA